MRIASRNASPKSAAFFAPTPYTVVQLIERLRPSLDHVPQRRVVKDHVGRHAAFAGEAQPHLAQRVEQFAVADRGRRPSVPAAGALFRGGWISRYRAHSASPRISAVPCGVRRSTGYGSPDAQQKAAVDQLFDVAAQGGRRLVFQQRERRQLGVARRDDLLRRASDAGCR